MLRDRQIVLPSIAGATSVILGSPCATGLRLVITPVSPVKRNSSVTGARLYQHRKRTL
jgi:hypothetical protein